MHLRTIQTYILCLYNSHLTWCLLLFVLRIINANWRKSSPIPNTTPPDDELQDIRNSVRGGFNIVRGRKAQNIFFGAHLIIYHLRCEMYLIYMSKGLTVWAQCEWCLNGMYGRFNIIARNMMGETARSRECSELMGNVMSTGCVCLAGEIWI